MKNFPNIDAFAALHADGSIATWGRAESGGTGGPTDNGYVSVFTSEGAFAALKADGSINAWGDPVLGGAGGPTDAGYNQIYSTRSAFAAIKADGSIATWGDPNNGGSNGPTDAGYIDIFSNGGAFAAIKADGSIHPWGDPVSGGAGGPSDAGYVDIFSTELAFAAIKADGSIATWGDPNNGGSNGPTDAGYVDVVATAGAFAAIKADGTMVRWRGSYQTTSTSGYTNLHGGLNAIFVNAPDGSFEVWWGGDTAESPAGPGYIRGYSSFGGGTILNADGTVVDYGLPPNAPAIAAPTDAGYVDIYTSFGNGLAGMKGDGSITTWGGSGLGGTGGPTDAGYVHIMSTIGAFAAMKADGSITVWGDPEPGGSGAPTDTGYISINGISPTPSSCALTNSMSGINLDSSTVVERTPSGTAVTQLTTDDTTASGPYTYSLVSGFGDEDNTKFTIVDDQLTLAFTPDYETPVDRGDTLADNTYSVRVQVTDSNGETYHDHIIVTITDLAEHQITGTIALDTNRDQQASTGELDISGAELELRTAGPDGSLGTADDVAIDTATTASPYTFSSVLPGNYHIVVNPDSLGAGIYPTGDTTANITVTTSSVIKSFTANYLKVSGTLTDSSGQPIPNTVVTLTDSQGNTFTATTDPNGNYVFEGSEANPLYAGSVTLTATVNGETINQSGTVADANPIKLDLVTASPLSITPTSSTSNTANSTNATSNKATPTQSTTLAATGITTPYALAISAGLLLTGLVLLITAQPHRRTRVKRPSQHSK